MSQELQDQLPARRVVTAAPAFYRIADGKFLQPVHLGGRACGWTPDALQAWIKDPQGYVVPRFRE